MDDGFMLFADDRAAELKVHCPLCKKVYIDPFISTCGHTFCLKCIKDNAGECPLDAIKFSPVVKNIAVYEQVGELLVHCCYGVILKDGHAHPVVDTNGCQAVIKISEKHEHEENCEFKPISCPNDEECPKMFRKELEQHLQMCQNVKCPHHKYGCPFKGKKEQVTEHVQNCKFEGVKDYLQSLDEIITELKKDIITKDSLITNLQGTVTELEERLSDTEKNAALTSKRLDDLEERSTSIMKAVSSTTDNFEFVMSKLTLVEHQLGTNPIEPQLLFKCQGTFVGHKGPVWSLCISNDVLFSASSDNTIKSWNLRSIYEGPRTMTGHDGIILAVCSKDNYLYSGSSDKTIKVWDTKTLSLVSSFVAHDDPICSLTTHENKLYSGSLRSIKVWDLSDDNKLLKVLPTQNHWVRALAVSGKYLYSGSYRAVKIWDLLSMEVAHVLQCNGGSVYSLALTSRYIVCGTYENMIHLWDINTLAEITSLSGHVGTVYALAELSNPGGQSRLFSASYDKTIRVWNMDLMTCAQTMSRHEGSVTCLTVNRGSIISGSVDNNIKIWRQ
ncbi:PREDICTED: E3 ubiquitin-protein ligase TRAF7-like [Amphimedon queenslandica]|uniref:RING-type domain-containing protein n=1 Tax=Amphimedon queenslandica TaxID=400682 RepID=A0AAN0IZ36_AMPQE|nr:PREDICTED: E3 ubiquitin-protein ligase TRAF7-like [Amphimedon queenslandica]|eukprot:XP_019849787.1 PREDICTED: E3 ubiquitin-protein ligase TRAF7-like [Amphimedon queenslandica]